MKENEPIPQGYKKIPYHFVFDAKVDCRRKARLVAEGHKAPDISKEELYSGVVLRIPSTQIIGIRILYYYNLIDSSIITSTVSGGSNRD